MKTKNFYLKIILKFTYSILWYLCLPLLIIDSVARAFKNPIYYQKLQQNLGFVSSPLNTNPVIWIHVVSLGEAIAITPLVNELQKEYSMHRLWITTATVSGSNYIIKNKESSVCHSYVCFDAIGAINRFLAKVNPKLLILVETEIWPNIISSCHYKKIPIVLANARMSEQSKKGYLKFKPFTTEIFKKITTIMAQDSQTEKRMLALGVKSSQLHITGSIKFDFYRNPSLILKGKALRKKWEQGMETEIKILAAVSTHEHEEEIILNAYKVLRLRHPQMRLLLVPRHENRFSRVYQLIQKSSLDVIRHSTGVMPYKKTQVILGDTQGEMMTFLNAADISFVGGSLVSRGGHNVLEPASAGIPILSGPHVFNFKDICQKLYQNQCLKFVTCSEDIVKECHNLLVDTKHYQQMSSAAKIFVANNQGAVKQHIRLIKKLKF